MCCYYYFTFIRLKARFTKTTKPASCKCGMLLIFQVLRYLFFRLLLPSIYKWGGGGISFAVRTALKEWQRKNSNATAWFAAGWYCRLSWHKKENTIASHVPSKWWRDKKKGRASRNNELREVPLMLIWYRNIRSPLRSITVEGKQIWMHLKPLTEMCLLRWLSIASYYMA